MEVFYSKKCYNAVKLSILFVNEKRHRGHITGRIKIHFTIGEGREYRETKLRCDRARSGPEMRGVKLAGVRAGEYGRSMVCEVWGIVRAGTHLVCLAALGSGSVLTPPQPAKDESRRCRVRSEPYGGPQLFI